MKINDDDVEKLRTLTEVIGPSNYEAEVQEVWKEMMAPFVDDTFSDNIGNAYAVKGKKRNSPLPYPSETIMIQAHADTIGFQVQFIEDGFVFTRDVESSGTIDPRTLPGSKVSVLGRKTNTVYEGHFIPPRPFHFLDSDGLDEVHKRYDIGIDVGAFSDEDLEGKISIGDYVVFRGDFERRNVFGKDLVVSPSIDNRVGLWEMYLIARELHGTDYNVAFVSSPAEEVTARDHVRVAANRIKPWASITLDTTPATDTVKDIDESDLAKQFGLFGLDKGPVIPRGDGANENLFQILESRSGGTIPYQVENGDGVMDNAHVLASGEGVQAIGIYTPVRNLHSPVETVCLGDVEKVVDLATRFIDTPKK